MWSVLAIVLFARSSTASDTVAWYSAPNFRGTWDLVVGCVLTLTICVWSALHLNVPTEKSTLTERNLRRTKWIILGIFAPELVVSSAFAQYLTARWLRREILEDTKYRKAEGTDLKSSPEQQLQEWTVTQCYFAVMGGITVQASDCLDDHPRLSLTPEGIRLMSFLGRLPEIRETQIRDKSKADGLAKTLVCLQAGWMILQTIARVQQRLPVTLLEINTIGHVLCALVLYLLWWSKPLEVKDPVLLPREDWMDPYLSLMWMCSPISGDPVDEITEMRCMAYIPRSQRAQGISTNPATDATTTTQREIVNDEKPKTRSALQPHETHFNIGSTAARNPRKFIGPLGDFRVGSNDNHHDRSPSPSTTPYDHHVSYIVNSDSPTPIASEHTPFFTHQTPHHSLQHSPQYCRRALPDCVSHDPLSPSALHRWRLSCTIIDDLWDQCTSRPTYKNFYFTTSTLGTFVGEKTYLDAYAKDFLGLSYLGSVNVHKDRLKSVLAFAGAAYGALHIAAWNEYFPTPVERYLWITSSVAIGASGIFLWLFFLAKERSEGIDRAVSEAAVRQRWLVRVLGRYVLVPLFVAARVYLVVEGFVSLRRVERGVYSTPEWSRYFPHL